MSGRKKHVAKKTSDSKPSSNSPETADVTVEGIQKKIEELQKLQKQIDPSYKVKKKSRLPSFQTMYIIMEILMCIAVVGLSIYVYQTNQKKQAMLKAVIDETKKKIENEKEAIAVAEVELSYDTIDPDEFETEEWKEFKTE